PGVADWWLVPGRVETRSENTELRTGEFGSVFSSAEENTDLKKSNGNENRNTDAQARWGNGMVWRNTGVCGVGGPGPSDARALLVGELRHLQREPSARRAMA